MKQEHNNREMERFRARLKHCGLRATAQRLAVHEALTNLSHASADTVHSWIEANLPTDITLASVYNILSQMAELGIYGHRMSDDSRMYFDINTLPHLHMYDRKNHSYRDIIDEALYQDMMQRLGRRRFKGYKLESIDIQFIVRPTTRRRP